MPAKKLPYKNLAGICPCPAGWLVLPGRMAGITVTAEDAFVVKNLFDVLDYRPTFDAAAIEAPMGLKDEPGNEFRLCEKEAREFVGWPRAAAISGTPSRPALMADTNTEAAEMEPWMNSHDKRRLRWLREAAKELQPYHTRRFFSAHPDVSFTAMNGDEPLKTLPYHEDGRLERLKLLREQLPGIDEIVNRPPPDGAHFTHMLSVGALMWTARRASGRAISRLPLDPFWDTEGMRMELVR